MVVAAHDEFRARIDRLSGRLRSAARGDLQRRRTLVHVLSSRRGLAGYHARLALRGRHAAELAHQLRAAMRTAGRWARAAPRAACVSVLEQRDLARHLAAMRGRLNAADTPADGVGGPDPAARRRALQNPGRTPGKPEPARRPRRSAASYAVSSHGTPTSATAIVRSAASVAPGDRVHVTVADGEIDCRVSGSQEG